MTHAPTADGWRRSFADQSQSEFVEQFADEIALEASTLAPLLRKSSVTEKISQSGRGPLSDGIDDATHVSAAPRR